MAAKKKPPKNQKTDKAQSDRFKETARQLEVAGELNLSEAEKALERLVRNASESGSSRPKTHR